MYVYGTNPFTPQAMVRDGVTYRIVSDTTGSVRLVIETATGAVVQRIDYDSFGRIINDTNPGFQPFGFQGGLYDPETSLVRFGAREYAPQTGRWLSKDPIGFVGGLNQYVFCGNNPVNFVDPFGLWIGVDDAIFAGVGALAGLVGQGIGDAIAGEFSGWEAYSGAAFGGAACGEIVLYTGNPLLAGAGGAALGNATKQGLQAGSGRRSVAELSPSEYVLETSPGAVTGHLGGKVPSLSSGRGSYAAVTKQIVTKAQRDQISRISASTTGKMITYRAGEELSGVASSSARSALFRAADAASVADSVIRKSYIPNK